MRSGIESVLVPFSPLHIAIDGPVAAGKGTVARLLAEKLKILYIDTGAMYRTVALLAERAGIAWSDEAALSELASTIDFELRPPTDGEHDGRTSTILANGEDVSWLIRTQQLSQGGSDVSKLAGVRRALVKLQQHIAKNTSVVMEGRDITSRVLPEAAVKVFLTASLEERAHRRHQELLQRGQVLDLRTVIEQIRQRDHQDSQRKVDPLVIVTDAVVIDSTQLSVEQVVARIVELVPAQTNR